MYMTIADIRKLAIRCQLERETQSEASVLWYKVINLRLRKHFNVGKAKFAARMNQLVSRDKRAECPWDHVGIHH